MEKLREEKNAIGLMMMMMGLAYLAVLPMARTIALRNLLLGLLLIFTVINVVRDRSWPTMVRYVSWSILAWTVYLLIFPFVSTNAWIAWENVVGQWGKSVLAMAVGGYLALRFSSTRLGRLRALAIASFTPLAVYLALFLWKAFDTHSLPLGYLGIEEHHGYLGYAASQACILLAAVAVGDSRRDRLWATTLIVLALICMPLVRSRGGLVFSVFGAVLVVAAAVFGADGRARRRLLAFFVLAAGAGLAIFLLATKTDPRWQHIGERLSAGWMGNAIEIECKGTAAMEPAIIERFGTGPETDRTIAQIQDGDGARMVLLRAASQLTLEHPWGLDGSRQAFQKRLREICPEPTYTMAHAHNGWLDTALAIGWAGAALYLLVLLYFLRLGWRALREESNTDQRPWALILVAGSAFWIVRGLVDSCYRDHMLEMQGFVLAYAATALHVLRKPAAPPATRPS